MIAVTGVTGGMGGRIAARLAARGAQQRLLVRDPSRAPSLERAEVAAIGGYDDAEGLRAALDGCDVLMLIPAHEDRDRVALHRTVVNAAVAAGVGHLVYLSFVGATPDHVFTFGRDHFHTEEAIRATGARFTFVRMNLYADFAPALCGPDGVIRGPAGDGRVALVARDDLADVCTEVLLDPAAYDGATLDVTGPEALTLDEVAAAVGAQYVAETREEAFASRAGLGADWEVAGWVGTYLAIADGLLDEVTDTVERVAGHPARTLRRVLAG